MKIIDIYEDFEQIVNILASKYQLNREEAKDYTQQAFLTLLGKYEEKIEDQSRLKSIIIKTAYRLYLKDKTMKQDDFFTNFITDESKYTDTELMEILLILTYPHTEVFRDFYMNDLTRKEIARKKKLTESAIKSKLYRGRELLKQRLEKFIQSVDYLQTIKKEITNG